MMTCWEEIHFHRFPSRTHIYSTAVIEDPPWYFVATKDHTIYRIEATNCEDKEKWHVFPCQLDTYDSK
jgi:hypothetical protein